MKGDGRAGVRADQAQPAHHSVSPTRQIALSEWRLITATHNLLKLHKRYLAVAAA
jgi:hypothetical protein